MALGATGGQILGLFLRHGLVVVAVGIACGVVDGTCRGAEPRQSRLRGHRDGSCDADCSCRAPDRRHVTGVLHAGAVRHPRRSVGRPPIGVTQLDRRLAVGRVSVRPQRAGRLRCRCAPRRNAARDQAGDCDKTDNRRIRERIRWADAIERIRHQARQTQCACQPEHDSGRHRQQATTERAAAGRAVSRRAQAVQRTHLSAGSRRTRQLRRCRPPRVPVRAR